MAANSERLRILKMIEEGKISAEEGAKLLEALQESDAEPEQTVPLFQHRAEGARIIKIRVTDGDTGKVKVNLSLPFGVVDFIQGFIPRKEKEKLQDQGVNLDTLIESVRSGQVGKIVDIEDEEEGHRIEVIVE